MSELSTVDRTSSPLSDQELREALIAAGLRVDATVLVHCSLSRLGWIIGGAQTVLSVLLEVVSEGTLMMPAFTAANSDPKDWRDPPVPEAWWPAIRQHHPPFDPVLSPTRQMGVVAELFRALPGTERSSHPTNSFAARGVQASHLLQRHALAEGLGEASPLGRLYELDGDVLLLGVTHENNSSLHLAEHRAEYPGKRELMTGSAMLVDGVRQWVSYPALTFHDADFETLGAAFDVVHPEVVHALGSGEVRLFRQRVLVDFAVEWMQRYRTSG